MAAENLSDLSEEQLKKKEKDLKVILGMFAFLIIALFFFIGRDYFLGKEVETSMVTIAICTLGGPAVLYPELKQVKKEMLSRSK